MGEYLQSAHPAFLQPYLDGLNAGGHDTGMAQMCAPMMDLAIVTEDPERTQARAEPGDPVPHRPLHRAAQRCGAGRAERPRLQRADPRVAEDDRQRPGADAVRGDDPGPRDRPHQVRQPTAYR